MQSSMLRLHNVNCRVCRFGKADDGATMSISEEDKAKIVPGVVPYHLLPVILPRLGNSRTNRTCPNEHHYGRASRGRLEYVSAETALQIVASELSYTHISQDVIRQHITALTSS